MANPTLRKGDRGSSVRRMQMLLNAQLDTAHRITADGDFGDRTFNAVQRFQRLRFLEPADGIVGPVTWRVLEGHPARHAIYRYPTGPQEPLADIAVPYIGAREAHGNHMGSDPRMREIFESDRHSEGGETDGYPWCCAFVSMCVQKLIDQTPAFSHVGKPYTASVSYFRTQWAPAQNCLVFAPTDAHHHPHKGDVVVYRFSHIGIVESVGSHKIKTIEGNTNEAGSREGTSCMRKERRYAEIRCFIRFPLLGNPT